MKIIIIAGFGFSLIQFRGDLIRSWLEKGHEVIAIAPGVEVKAKLEALGARYITAPLERTSINPGKDFLLLIYLIKLVRQEKPDRLFLYTIKPIIYGSLAAYFYPSGSVFSMITGLGYIFIAGVEKRGFLKSLVTILYRIALKRNKKVFFQNPDDLSEFIKLKICDHDKALVVNGSGVDLEHYYLTPHRESEICFLLIARLIKDKGFFEFIEAARVLKKKYPKTIFRIIGWALDGASVISNSQLEKWREEGIVDILGKTDDVRPYIAEASVYVLPSYYREGTPRSVLEAMAMGRPIITTDAPGCRETVVEGVNGYLVPVRDSEALAKAMERFIAEPKLIAQMGAESRRIAEEKYDVHKVNKVINEAMGLG